MSGLSDVDIKRMRDQLFFLSVAGEPAGPGARCAVGDESRASWIWEAPDCVMEGTAGNG